MSEWTLYWLTRLDPAREVLVGLTILGGIAVATGVFFGFMLRCEGEPAGKAIHRACVRWAFLPALSGLTLAFVPTTKEAAAILVLPAVANSEAVQEIGSELHTLAREWLKAQIEEVRK